VEREQVKDIVRKNSFRQVNNKDLTGLSELSFNVPETIEQLKNHEFLIYYTN